MDIRDRVIEMRRVRLGDLIPNEKNWRTHPQKQRKAYKQLVTSIGFAGAELVYQLGDGSLKLIDGHMRRDAHPDSVLPVIVTDLNEEEADVLLATFDPLAALAGTSNDKLSELLKSVRTDFTELDNVVNDIANEFDIEFDDEELPDVPPARVDEADELNKKWQVMSGDLWIIPSQHGEDNHRLLCGDSTQNEDVETLLSEQAILMVTDPPYGIEYNQDWRSSNRSGKVQNDHRADWREAYQLSGAEIVYVWHASRYANVVQDGLEDCGFELRAQIIWNKPRHVFSQGHYHWKHEPCHYAVRKGCTAHWIGERTNNTVWDIALDEDVEGGHGTQKPVECMERPIRNHDAPIVYDPFGGSGTTMIASERQKRLCYMMELHPPYCAVILERMKQMGLVPYRVE